MDYPLIHNPFKPISAITVAMLALSPFAFGQDGDKPSPPNVKPRFSFGAVADCQYCDQPDRGKRLYRSSPEKLKKCVDHLNTMDLRYVVHLGDFIDREYKSYDVVLPIFGRLKAKQRFVLGNHDFDVADEHKPKVPGRLGLTNRYYDFVENDWRFIALDTNDISLYAHPKGSAEHAASKMYYEKLKAERGKGPPTWNGGVGPKQMAWLQAKLKEAAAAKQNVVVYSHHPVYPPNSHNVWNDKEVIQVLERHPNVKAYINGHNHKGHYGKKNNIHYLTLKGMVDTKQNSYATIDVHTDRLIVNGVGREPKRELVFGPIESKPKPAAQPTP